MKDGQKPEAIIFDLDGLLVDSERVWAMTDVLIVESRGKTYDPDIEAYSLGMSAEECLEGLRRAYDIEDDVETLNRESLKHMLNLIPTEVKAQPGANEIIAFVAQQNITRAIVSNSQQVFIDAIFSRPQRVVAY